MVEGDRYRIGYVAKLIGVRVDTLRYYEKCGLLPRVARTSSGAREFDAEDISRLRFIRRAQAMNFTLAEVAALLDLRDRPRQPRSAVRDMAQAKVREIDERVSALMTLRDELSAMVSACPGTGPECPILAGIEGSTDEADRRG